MNREGQSASLAAYRAIATAHDRHAGRWRYYYAEMGRLLSFIVPDDASVVQLGSGSGDLLAALPGKEKTGIECVPELIAKARLNHPDLSSIEDDFWNLRTKKKFDYALIAEITDSLPDIELVLKEGRKVLADRGRLIIVTRSRVWRPLFVLAKRLRFLKAQGPFRNLLRLRDLENMLHLAGFEVVSTGRGILCPVRIPLLSALLNRVAAHLPLFSFFGAIQYVVARPYPLPRREVAVSVVVAARNEKGNIGSIIDRVPSMGVSTEVVIVEGHSSDGTWEEMKRVKEAYRGPLSLVIAQQEGKGKWDAVKKGFSLASGELLMILDADMTVPPEDLPRFYDAYADGRGDFINGSRFIYPMEGKAMRFLNKVGNRFFIRFVSLIIGVRLTDTLCGTKVFSKNDYVRFRFHDRYFSAYDPFGDFDLIFSAAKRNLRIVELPIAYKDRTYGQTQISRFSDGYKLLRMCLFVLARFTFRV